MVKQANIVKQVSEKYVYSKAQKRTESVFADIPFVRMAIAQIKSYVPRDGYFMCASSSDH
jgi:hypothetical protein